MKLTLLVMSSCYCSGEPCPLCSVDSLSTVLYSSVSFQKKKKSPRVTVQESLRTFYLVYLYLCFITIQVASFYYSDASFILFSLLS